ncbi:MAG: ATP-grasp domain-containing protein [Gammaproteobacteria bacterium]|nr:ATP-grasp domain-containing protein [Gammaproteobacteria bacterium]
MAKKRILILNGSHSEIPLIESAKSLNFHVITTGNLPNLPGHRFADEYHSADFSDEQKILELAKELKIDAICSCANDFGAITAAYVAEKLNLPGHDSFEKTLLVHHKDLFKNYALDIDFPTPFAQGFDNKSNALSSEENFQYPLIIKPVDLTGGKGISTIHKADGFSNAIEKAFSFSRAGRIVVEEFFIGTQHSFSAFIVNQSLVFHFSDNEYSFKNPYLVSTSSAPSSNIDKFREQLVIVAEQFAKSLHLVDGVLHFQYLASDDEFKIIEITRRCSGDLYPLPVDFSSDVDWASWIVRAESGLDCMGFPDTRQSGYCGRHCLMAASNGRLKSIQISDEIRNNIFKEYNWWKEGDLVENYLMQKFGVLLLKFSSLSEMQDKIDNIHQLVKVELI